MSIETGLADRLVVVTGAASGIGRAVTGQLVRERARVLAVDRDAGALRELAAESELIEPLAEDLTDVEAPARIVAAATARGGVDILISNAGIGHAAPAHETSLELWETTFAVNARAPFLLSREAIPGMLERGGGAIVFVSSAVAVKAVANRAAYGASKSAVIGLAKSISVDYAARGIRANCVAPGTVDTPWINRVLADAPDADERRRAMADRQLLGRLGTVDEIADAVIFLASDRASFAHGSVLVVDGGFTTR
jgi:meso-butanediol dehydrogenase / (S,S)-butanediol dehydrogenase / diacetyl reductase